jgi:hypothetical protein
VGENGVDGDFIRNSCFGRVDGFNVRGAVVLAETPKSLTLMTLAGNLNPADVLHLRGHFGVPKFEGMGWRARRQGSCPARAPAALQPCAFGGNFAIYCFQ